MKTEISVESKHQTLQGLAFPLQPDAQQAIQALKQKKINYIQLVGPSNGFSVLYSPHPAAVSHFHLLPVPSVHQKLDLERETIDLVHTSPTEISDLPKRIPQDSARYHFFLYKHSHEGDYLESVGESLSTGKGQFEPVPIPVFPGALVAQGASRDGGRDGATGSLESVPSRGGCWQSLWCHVQCRSLGQRGFGGGWFGFLWCFRNTRADLGEVVDGLLTLWCWMLSGTLGWIAGGMQAVLSGRGPRQCHRLCSLFCSLYLLHAWVQVQHQGAHALLQLQEPVA